MDLNLMIFQLSPEDLACTLPTSLLAQVRGGRGIWRDTQNAAQLGASGWTSFLTNEHGR